MVGLGILIGIAGVAVYAATLPLPWSSTPIWCSTDYGPGNSNSGYPGPYVQTCPTTGPIVCTYEIHPPPNAARYCGGVWFRDTYRAGIAFPSIIPPTLSLSPFAPGPLPLGALSTSASAQTPMYDVAGMLARGADWSLIFSVSIVGAGAALGLLLGAIAGYYGGVVDEVLMRIVDIFLSIPTILFVIVVVAVLAVDLHPPPAAAVSTKLGAMILGFTIVWWPFYARIVRGQVLVVREQKFVEAATASGSPRHRTLLRHIIPNSVYPVFIQFSLDVGTIPLLIGSLAFLGFGSLLFPSSPFPEWGATAAASVTDLAADFVNSCYTPATGCVIPWWQLLFPGIALFLFAISVNLLSDGIRDALDPRLRR